MSWTILISFDPNRGICAIIGIAQAEDAAKQGEIQFDQMCGQIITSAIKQLALLFENPSKERCCFLS